MREHPTPTQHEVDLIKLGANLMRKEPVDEPERPEPVRKLEPEPLKIEKEPGPREPEKISSRSMEADRSGAGYSTRQMRAESKPARTEPTARLESTSSAPSSPAKTDDKKTDEQK